MSGYLAGVKRARVLRVLTRAIMAYMFLAFAWWAVLLWLKNRDAFAARAQATELVLAAEGQIATAEDWLQSAEYEELATLYRKDNYQIIGEALVFVLTLLAGVYLVNLSYRREVESARQQRNFLLSITHELKSPLAGIRLSLETINRRQLTPEQQRRFTDQGLSETGRLTSLVEDLLLSARLDSSYEPNREPLDLRAVAESWIERMRLKYQDIKFRLELEGQELTILADHYGVNSVLSNLLENAVKYIGDGDEVALSVRERGADVQIQVSDNGVGIPEPDRASVFDKFYRVGNEDTRSTKGTGLGLYIVKEVIHAHGGSVSLRPNLPRGSVFEICLPFGEQD